MYMHTKYGSCRTKCHSSQLGVCPPLHNVIKTIAIFVTAALLLNAMAPTLAHAATYLQGTEVNANTLIRDAYVQVTYRDNRGQEKTEKGWIDAIGETSFTIRSGGLKSEKAIAYANVVSVIMSDESTVPAKQMNEVNRFIRENISVQEAGQIRAQVLKGSGIDGGKVKIGTFVEVIYGKGDWDSISGTWETRAVARGYIKGIDAETLIVGERFRKKEIALDRVQKLKPIKNLRQSPLEIGAEILSVRYAIDYSDDSEALGALAGDTGTLIGMGGGLYGRLLPLIYVSGFSFSRLAFDLGGGLTSAYWDGGNFTSWGAQGGVAYFLSKKTSNAVYIRSFATILTRSTVGAGIGIGYRRVFQNKMAIRIEPSYMRWFFNGQRRSNLMLHLKYGVILGGKSPSSNSK